MEPSLDLWPEAKLDGSMQMPGLLQPLLSGTGQRQVSAIQGFRLEPVHEASEGVHSSRESAFLGGNVLLFITFSQSPLVSFSLDTKAFKSLGKLVSEWVNQLPVDPSPAITFHHAHL